jgi:hypothetical protein
MEQPEIKDIPSPAPKEPEDIPMTDAPISAEPEKPEPEPTAEAPKDTTVTLIRQSPVDYISPNTDSSSSSEDSDFDDNFIQSDIDAVRKELEDVDVEVPVRFFEITTVAVQTLDQLRNVQLPELAVEEDVQAKIEEPDAMDIDSAPPANEIGKAPAKTILPPLIPSEAPNVVTPSAEIESLTLQEKPRPKLALPPADESDKETAEELEALEAVRKKMRTPSVSTLPFTVTVPWFKDEEIVKSVDIPEDEDVMDYIASNLIAVSEERQGDIEEQSRIYKEHYRNWIRFHESDDPLAVRCRKHWDENRVQEISRQASVAPTEAKPEGRRGTSRWATEHDLERVLKQSEIEARAQQDRAAKAKAHLEKEAEIPDMLSPVEREKGRYGEYTNLIRPDRVLATFEVLPPIQNFTDWEKDTFEKAMIEYPKQWGKIAMQLPGRNYKHCIQYYYLVKHEENFKEKLNRRVKGRRKGRGKAKTSVHTVALGREDETEEPQPETDGGRRRPKRAAAPTFAFEQAPSESDTNTPVPTPGRRGAATPKDETAEKPTKGKRKAKKTDAEKASKAGKNAAITAAPPAGGSKAGKEKAETPQPLPMKEWQPPRRPSPEPLNHQFPQQVGGWQQYQSPGHAKAGGPVQVAPQEVVPIQFEQAHVPQQAQQQGQVMPQFDGASAHQVQGQGPPRGTGGSSSQNPSSVPAPGGQIPTSSYWSVPEVNDFPLLLQHFGTDWHALAKWMASKTHIMVYTRLFAAWLTVPADSNRSRRVANLVAQVKNYYQRQIDSGRSDLREIAERADEKRRRGESTGPPPVPSEPTVKRKFEQGAGNVAVQSPGRPLATPEEELYPAQQGSNALRFAAAALPGARYDQGSLGRPAPISAASYSENVDAKPPLGRTMSAPHPPVTSARFPTLAQAGPVPDGVGPPPRVSGKPGVHRAQVQAQAQPAGPRLGYFPAPSETGRPQPVRANTSHHQMHHSPSPIPGPGVGDVNAQHAAQRSHLVAQEAQMERERAQALRLQEQERERQRERERQLREEEMAAQQAQGFGEFRGPPQGTFVQQGQQVQGRQDDMRRGAMASGMGQFAGQSSFPQRSMPPDSRIASGPAGAVQMAEQQMGRHAMSAPPVPQPGGPVQIQQATNPAVQAVRQAEPPKKSSIMSLLNDDGPPSRAMASPAVQAAPPPQQQQPFRPRNEAGMGELRGAPMPGRALAPEYEQAQYGRGAPGSQGRSAGSAGEASPALSEEEKRREFYYAQQQQAQQAQQMGQMGQMSHRELEDRERRFAYERERELDAQRAGRERDLSRGRAEPRDGGKAAYGAPPQPGVPGNAQVNHRALAFNAGARPGSPAYGFVDGRSPPVGYGPQFPQQGGPPPGPGQAGQGGRFGPTLAPSHGSQHGTPTQRSAALSPLGQPPAGAFGGPADPRDRDPRDPRALHPNNTPTPGPGMQGQQPPGPGRSYTPVSYDGRAGPYAPPGQPGGQPGLGRDEREREMLIRQQDEDLARQRDRERGRRMGFAGPGPSPPHAAQGPQGVGMPNNAPPPPARVIDERERLVTEGLLQMRGGQPPPPQQPIVSREEQFYREQRERELREREMAGFAHGRDPRDFGRDVRERELAPGPGPGFRDARGFDPRDPRELAGRDPCERAMLERDPRALDVGRDMGREYRGSGLAEHEERALMERTRLDQEAERRLLEGLRERELERGRLGR